MKTINKFRIFSFIIFAAIIVLAGCEGDEGPMGPKGEPGSNAVKSVTYEVYKNDWQGDVNGYSVTLDIPEITNAIFDHGAVLIYLIHEDVTPHYSNLLPYTWINGINTEYMDADVFVGGAKIFFRWVDNGINTTERPTMTFVYKLVIMDGVSIAWLKDHVNINSLQSVEEYFKTNPIVF